MEVHPIDTNLRAYATSLKVNGHTLFSHDEQLFLFDNSVCSIYEFVQEPQIESDMAFYRQFISWLKEETHEGYVYYYLIAGMRKGEELTDDEYFYLEQQTTCCFEKGYGWLAVSNRERRFKRRLTLICFDKRNHFHRLIRKE